MFYKDLDNYLIHTDQTSGRVLNIGWLDRGFDFSTGAVPKEAEEKLLYLTLLANENKERPRKKLKNQIIVHTMYVRAPPFKCPFCDKEVILKRNNQTIVLGCNEMRIPNMVKKYIYSFPTLLYHYIKEHGYCPPDEFLQSLIDFDLSKGFDCNCDYKTIFKKTP